MKIMILIGRLFLVFALFSLSGCFKLSLRTPPPHQISTCLSIPQPSKDQVYIVMVTGFDPAGFGDLNGLRNYLHRLGFPKTINGHCYHALSLPYKLRGIHRENPDARFVLIGDDLGNYPLEYLASKADKLGVPIDMVVRVNSSKAEDHCYEDCRGVQCRMWYLGDITREDNLQLLTWELASVAGSIPVFYQPPPAIPGIQEPTPEPIPLPRPANPEQIPMPQSGEPGRSPRNRNPLEPVYSLPAVPEVYQVGTIEEIQNY